MGGRVGIIAQSNYNVVVSYVSSAYGSGAWRTVFTTLPSRSKEFPGRIELLSQGRHGASRCEGCSSEDVATDGELRGSSLARCSGQAPHVFSRQNTLVPKRVYPTTLIFASRRDLSLSFLLQHALRQRLRGPALSRTPSMLLSDLQSQVAANRRR